MVDWQGKSLASCCKLCCPQADVETVWHRGNYWGLTSEEGRENKSYWIEGKVCDAGIIKPWPTLWGPQEQVLLPTVDPYQAKLSRPLCPHFDQSNSWARPRSAPKANSEVGQLEALGKWLGNKTLTAGNLRGASLCPAYFAYLRRMYSCSICSSYTREKNMKCEKNPLLS